MMGVGKSISYHEIYVTLEMDVDQTLGAKNHRIMPLNPVIGKDTIFEPAKN